MQTVPAALTLTDTYGSLTIRPPSPNVSDPIVCKEWDLGAPEVRVTSTPLTGADGTYDGAGFTGARTVTLDLVIFGDDAHSPYWYAERLAGMAHPGRRPTLGIVRPTLDTGGDSWTMELRGSPFAITYGRRAAALLEMQVVFNAPKGYLVSPLRSFTSVPATLAVLTGLSLPFTLPMTLGTGSGTNPGLTFTVAGSAPVAPVVAIYGPVVDPTISWGTEQFTFDGLTLGLGEYVVIDMEAGTVRLQGSPDASVYHLVDFAVSTFWRLPPGTNTVTYLASSGYIQVQFNERRLTI